MNLGLTNKRNYYGDYRYSLIRSSSNRQEVSIEA